VPVNTFYAAEDLQHLLLCYLRLYASFWKVSDANWQYSISKDGTEYLCKLYLEGYLHGMKSCMDKKNNFGFRNMKLAKQYYLKNDWISWWPNNFSKL